MPYDSSSLSSNAEEEALIALSLVPGLGPGRIRLLLAHFGSATAILQASTVELCRVNGIGKHLAQQLHQAVDPHQVDKQLLRAQHTEATLIPYWSPAYPPLLHEIDTPPLFLWSRGTLLSADQKSIAIVGTRRATTYGKDLAYSFAQELTQHGFTIVSGLAYGIDVSAHKGALDAGGRTLAVLGSGVDRIYPTAHISLAQRIIKQGALLSEFPLGTSPEAPNFPRRNRIIAGMTLGTLVIEAHETGGALITARLALTYNREVFTIPCPLHYPSGKGNHQLIRQGVAQLVTTTEEILEELAPEWHPPSTSTPELLPSLTAIEQTLYEALTTDPIPLDTLCDRTQVDPSTALVYLLNLEFKGLIRQMAGKQFYRIHS